MTTPSDDNQRNSWPEASGVPHDNGASNGYGAPQHMSDPNGYSAPQGMGNPSGYGAPQGAPASNGYGAPQGAGQPQGNPYGQQQGRNAFDQASQQAAQLGAAAKQSFEKASSALQSSSVKQLGYLPLLVGTIVFALLHFFKWFNLEMRYGGSTVSFGFNGLGYISFPKELVSEMSGDEKGSLWALSTFGILVPIAVVVLLILASLAFKNVQSQRRGGVLAMIGSSLAFYWILFGARGYGNFLEGIKSFAENILSGIGADSGSSFLLELMGFGDMKFASSTTFFYWIEVLLTLCIFALSVFLFWRTTKQDPQATYSSQPAQSVQNQK
ncbi:hypothetical protein GP473_07395 [Corynebacterium anserum]|uniref:Uncharacterized protein n=2 Tax=Corynebacterium anserum TaxID=2684406 RepID=A0A7G7YPT3_9CORY|nr:hypothetical protein GP473_07395 [Corynebacterium anserum]